MKISTIRMSIVILLFVASSPLEGKEVRKMTEMKLSSPEFSNGKSIPGKYSCDGNDISPPLVIEGVPKEAKSLAMIMDDPDAPAGLWVHWVLWDIDPATKEIAPGKVPPGAHQGVNSWKRSDYGGPCPPSGTHRYFFRLYALSDRLTLPTGANRKDLDHAMHGKIIAQCELMGVYSRNR